MIFRIWLSIPLLGHIRLSTICTIIVVFIYILLKFNRSKKFALYNAIVSIGFTLSIYEMIFNIVAGFFYLGSVEAFIQHFLPWHYIMASGWLILGFKQISENYSPSITSITLLAICITAWVIWMMIGFPYNVHTDLEFNIIGEILNVLSKTTLLFGYALGIQPHIFKQKSIH